MWASMNLSVLQVSQTRSPRWRFKGPQNSPSTSRVSAHIAGLLTTVTDNLVNRRTESLVSISKHNWVSQSGNWFDVSADLDDEAFLTYERISPAAGFLSKQWFLRGEYVYGEKTIARRPGREADSHSVSIDSYYFIQGLKRYAVLGYTFRVDNARANRYDYDSHALKLRYVHRESLANLPLELELEGKFEDRRYKSPDPFIRTEREDTRLRLSAELRL